MAEPPDKRRLKVFISYASQDKPIVRELSGRLASEGWIDTWVDEKKLLPGQDWRTKIEEAVETSDTVIICLSSSSVGKEGFVQKELRYAREIAFEKPDETIFLIPLRLDDCSVPRGLRFYQWGDYFGEKRDETYSALLEALKIRHEQKLKLEEAERVRLEKERLEREAIERAAREKAERETAERIAREEAEKIAREQARREAAEKAKREKKERLDAQKANLAKIVSNSVTWLNKSKSFVSIASFTGIIIALLWGFVLNSTTLLAANTNVTPGATATPTITRQPSNIPTSYLKNLFLTGSAAPTSTKTQAPTPTLTPTITLTPTPIPTDSFLLQEDFEDGFANGWRYEKSVWVIEEDLEGNHYMSGSGTNPGIFYYDNTSNWTDYAFESRIKFIKGRNLDLYVHVSSSSYFFSMGGGTVWFGQYKNSVGTVLGGELPKIFDQNKWYTFRVEFKGNLISAYVDDVFILDLQLPSPLDSKQGGVGFQFNGEEKAYLDDVRIWSLK